MSSVTRRLFAGLGIGLTVVVGVRLRAAPSFDPPGAQAPVDAGRVTGAIEFFEGRLAGDRGNSVYEEQLVSRYMQRFQLLAHAADLDRAEALARGLVEVDPDAGGAHGRLAAVLLARHAFAEGLEHAQRAVAESPRDHAAWAVLFDAALATGRYELASDALARLEPGSVTRRLKSAFWLAAQGRAGSARGQLLSACERIATWSIGEQEAFCWTELGNVERSRGSERAALARYAQALAAVPGYRPAVEGLADMAYAAGKLESAETLYRRIAVDAHPDLYLRLAELRRLRGDPAGAAHWEERFLWIATAGGSEALYGRWLALFWAESPSTRDLALTMAARDVARRPAVESWDALAWVHYRRGELPEALAASDRAMAWGAPSPTIEYRRARILEGLGRGREAASLLERATEDPGQLEPEARADLRARAQTG